MKITRKWLIEQAACPRSIYEFTDRYGDREPHRNEVLLALEGRGTLYNGYYAWLVKHTLWECPLPDGWIFPDGLRTLYLERGKFPAGSQLPRNLAYLSLTNVSLPEHVKLPETLRSMFLSSGDLLPPNTVIPDSMSRIDICTGNLHASIRVPNRSVLIKYWRYTEKEEE